MPTTSAGTASGVWSLASSIGPGLETSRLHAASAPTPATAIRFICVFIYKKSRQWSEGGTEGEHDRLVRRHLIVFAAAEARARVRRVVRDRKSTRPNSSHVSESRMAS